MDERKLGKDSQIKIKFRPKRLKFYITSLWLENRHSKKGSIDMFGLELNEKKVVLKSEFKKLFAEGFKIVSKKSKDNGTRLWIIVEREQVRSLALVTLNHFPQIGWFANAYHEDSGIPQLNCPESLMYKFKRESA